MTEKENYMQNAGAPENQTKPPLVTPVPVPEVKSLDKVKEPPRRKRSRDREER